MELMIVTQADTQGKASDADGSAGSREGCAKGGEGAADRSLAGQSSDPEQNIGVVTKGLEDLGWKGCKALKPPAIFKY